MAKIKKRGMTIIEMLVAITIFTLGMGGFTLLFSRVWQGNSYTLEMGQASMTASQGVNKIVKYIREARQSDNGAYPVISADDNDLVFYSDYDRDGKAERLHFYRNGADVIMGIREPSSGFPVTYASGDGETQVISSRVVNAADNPIFAYYDSHYPEDSVNNPITTPATVPNIRLIRITLHININPNRDPDNVQIQSFAEIRNLNDHDRFGI
ncbi:MAG: prepilin-type N-terminal cleavage/methylation domain-containing protein [Patescibacteria group bacterium]